MSSETLTAWDVATTRECGDEVSRTRPRVQVVSLCVTVLASSALVAATHLPWYGPFWNDDVDPHYSAVSGTLVPPGSPAGVVPGTQSWGYLIIAWSLLLAGLATGAALACALSRRSGDARHLRRFLLVIGMASVILVALVGLAFVPRVPFDGPDTLGFSWGACLGLGLAVAALIGAWFAWATMRFPHLWASDLQTV